MNAQSRFFKSNQSRISSFGVLLIFIGFGAVLKAEDRTVTLSAEGPRPIGDAVQELALRYGWVITYEDPPYVHASDLRDVTELVRRDLADYPQGGAPRALAAKGGTVTVSYAVSAAGMVDSPAAVIQKVLDAGAGGGGASYRLLQVGDTFHVVPAQVKNLRGSLEPKKSILDERIYLLSQERDGMEMLEAICDAVSQAEGARVDVGTVPRALFRRVHAIPSATSGTAREFLMETLNSTGRKLSWQLLRDPSDGSYGLNIHAVPSQ